MTENTTLDIKFKQRLLPNLVSNIGYFILNFIIGFALVPFFVDTLGYAAYGIIPLATSVTSYVTMVIDALNIPVSRYLSIDLLRDERNKANVTYNTVLIGTFRIILILIPIGILVAFLTPYIFNIGEANTTEVVCLFLLIIGSVLIRAWGSNFMATLFAYNRLDYRNYVNITNAGIQVILIVGIFTIFGPALIYVGLAYLIAAVASLILAIYLSHKTIVYLVFSPNAYSKKLFAEIIKFAGWSLVDKLGCIINSTIGLIAANIIFGEIIATDYSIAQTIYSGLISVSTLVTTLFTPMIYSYVAKKDIVGLTSFGKLAVKTCGIMISLFVTLICIFTPQLLTLWMGSQYTYLTPLVWVVIIPSIIWVTISPVGPYNVALLKPQVSAISAVVTSILSVLLIWIFTQIFSFGIYGIVLATIISAILHAWVVCPIYNAYITHNPWYTFVFPMYGLLLYLIPILITSLLIINVVFTSSSWINIIMGCIVTILFLIVIPKIMLKPFERKIIRSLIPHFICKWIPQWLF